ncbi:hypothetical protein PanWU01x14_093080 [Parasponia andersonii]|uniref:Uncharacterized protein n=1 Tax=Parasponia andersonii TaxID=3476 RepID=A0A2P5D5X0_PARAD|nr:hypothetical protein PanWU01x14_093080 [Parasponia andersonii]
MAASSEGFEFNQFVFDAPGGEISSQMIKWNQKGNTTCQVLSWQHYQREKIKCWWEHTKPNELYHHHPSNEVAYNINKINTAAPCLALLFTLIRYHFVQVMVGLHKIILLVQKQLSCTSVAKKVHANCKYVDEDDHHQAWRDQTCHSAMVVLSLPPKPLDTPRRAQTTSLM